jgi:hypothetical protein
MFSGGADCRLISGATAELGDISSLSLSHTVSHRSYVLAA